MADGGGLQLFDTAVGRCGVAWTGRGIARLALPEQDDESLLERLGHDATVRVPPAGVRRVLRRLVRHLDGKHDDLRGGEVRLDLGDASPFARRVYQALRRIGPGRTITYGELALRAGHPGGARATGRAVGANPLPLLVPCHRVLPAHGGLGGFSATGGPALKARLLHVEGHVLDAAHEEGRETLKRDRVLRPIIDRVGPYLGTLGAPADPFETLVVSIVHQQISMKAGRSIYARLCALGEGGRLPAPATLARMRASRLRSVGLSGQKVSYVKDLARKVGGGELDLRALRRLSDDQVIERLVGVRGIGEWTAQMFLLFHLGRLDVLPVGDLGLCTAAREAYGLPELPRPAELIELAEPWRPYRSMATWYLWRSLGGGQF